MQILQDASHRRFNPLTGDWVLVSPHRVKRPWQGQTEAPAVAPTLRYDPQCYLCAGNARAAGKRNPQYSGVFAFDNDFPALTNAACEAVDEDGLIVAESESGRCRVLCFSERHDLTLARMETAQIEAVVSAWRSEYQTLGAQDDVSYVQIFENRGAMMGASNPHPHAQIWATQSVPNEPAKEGLTQAEHFARKGSALLDDYLALELRLEERIVCENEGFVALVPFWATWPFESLVLARRRLRSLDDFAASDMAALADVLRRVTIRYDNLFRTEFPYSMGFHQAPTDSGAHEHWRFHAHFYPPLLRSASVRKFMVGFEMLGSPQRDLTPEEAALRLRDLPERHHSEASHAESDDEAADD